MVTLRQDIHVIQCLNSNGLTENKTELKFSFTKAVSFKYSFGTHGRLLNNSIMS